MGGPPPPPVTKPYLTLIRVLLVHQVDHLLLEDLALLLNH
jgi:hypothetical protein